MKKVMSILVALMVILPAFAFDVNGTFGMKEQDTPEGYQQYVGKQFKVRYASGELETWEKSGFKPKDEIISNTYTITKVTVKDVDLNGKPNKEVTVEAVQDGSNKKVKFKGYQKVSVKMGFWGDIKKWPLIGYMPIMFIEPFNEFKTQNVGKIISNPIVKDTYEVIDAYVARGSGATAALGLEVKNTRTGQTKKVLYDKKDTAPFSDALEGKYTTALIKVEKPEDSSDRYSEVKTITDAGVDKYSFNDSTINITIYGTPEQFNFILKNVSPHSLRIIWNEAAFVGLDGSTSKIMHAGVKYSQREGDQPATTVIKGAKIDDLACPTANVYYDKGSTIGYTTVGNGWKTRSMFPSEYKGKDAGEIRLMLPIQVKDVVNEYTFVFKVYYKYSHPELLNQENL
ncbi:MAG: hypothetical protein K1W01_11455 [Muribaculaceae bacterium]